MQTPEIIKELKRELGMRQRLYPDWVASGKLSSQTAEHRIKAIEQAIALLQPLADMEETQQICLELS